MLPLVKTACATRTVSMGIVTDERGGNDMSAGMADDEQLNSLRVSCAGQPLLLATPSWTRYLLD